MALSVKVKDGFLIFRLRLQKPVRSKSTGKTRVIATTHGTLTTNATFRGKHILVNVNAFIYPREIEWKQRAKANMLKAEGKLE
jgi:hypothetical protein